MLDGVNLRDLDLSEVRRRITVLFQEPVHYHATAMGNIDMGNLKEAPNELRVWQRGRQFRYSLLAVVVSMFLCAMTDYLNRAK